MILRFDGMMKWLTGSHALCSVEIVSSCHELIWHCHIKLYDNARSFSMAFSISRFIKFCGLDINVGAWNWDS